MEYIFDRLLLFIFCRHCIKKDDFTLHNSLGRKERNDCFATHHFPLVFDEDTFHCFIFIIACIESARLILPSSQYLQSDVGRFAPKRRNEFGCHSPHLVTVSDVPLITWSIN